VLACSEDDAEPF